MSNSQATELPARWNLMILLLAIAGGSVDAVLILAFNVLTGAQTGNTVLLGAALAQVRLAAAFGSMVSVVGYVIGAAVGEFILTRHEFILIRHHHTWRWPSAVGMVLIAELIPLGCLLILWLLAGPHPVQETIDTLVICAAGAMGIQSAAMLRLHGGPTTTYITGTLTAFATKLIRWLKLVEAASASPERQELILMTAFSAVAGPWIYGLTWFVYATGVVLGGLLFLHTREMALLLPIVAVVIVIILGREEQNGKTELKQGQIGTTAPRLAESDKSVVI
jgi:uncharacterized membrane protein YoaK (UPF0700 family)